MNDFACECDTHICERCFAALDRGEAAEPAPFTEPVPVADAADELPF
jgi:hypothetical protein